MKTPLATYRLQFSERFVFSQAMEVVEYLTGLGVSDIYASPIFEARKGSTSGYDVIDYRRIARELGGEQDFLLLHERVRRHGLGWVQDIVPNHMGFDGTNPMLSDVFEKGPASNYFGYFDVEWEHPYEPLRGRLLAPFLGRFYGEALEGGEIRLQYGEEGFSVLYSAFRFPLKMGSYGRILTHGWSALQNKLGRTHPDLIKFLGVLYILRDLPGRGNGGELYDQVDFVKRMIYELYATNPDIRRHLDENVRLFNGLRGNPESFRLLDNLLSEQHFRLSFWKVASEEINYRRFFTINDLISLRVEEERVFQEVHSLILRFVGEGKFTGLRVDHIDGLLDPTGYLERLKERVGDVYLVVEKILGLDEELPTFWPVQGTTGYDFANFACGVLCAGRNEAAFDQLYSRFTGLPTPYPEVLYRSKKLIIEKDMIGDVTNLAYLLKRALSGDRYGGDITLYGFHRAIIEVMAFFPVYRTYMRQDVRRPADRACIREAIQRARAAHPALLYELNFIEQVLLLEFPDYLSPGARRDRVDLVMRFQQFTGPLMAKGFEDTALYVYNRFLPLNEVGGDPSRFGVSIEEFHGFNAKRALLWPDSLNATATHDTKRGEDVRARLAVLSELPGEWEERIKRWSRINTRLKKRLGGRAVPERNEEYFLYQTLVGAFPFGAEGQAGFLPRMKEYARKAVREAKVRTAWINPDTAYEEAMLSFLEGLLEPSPASLFRPEFLPFQSKVAFFGIWNSLSQTLLKITSPGVPDFYQGTELWDFSLVDPDNRRPVDFARRKAVLEEIRTREGSDLPALIRELLATREDGRIKFFLIHRALRARKDRAGIFQERTYLPLPARGRFKDHVVAFARRKGGNWAVTVVPRLLTALVKEGEIPVGERWEDTALDLPEGAPFQMEEAISGQKMEGGRVWPISRVLGHFPVALLLN